EARRPRLAARGGVQPGACIGRLAPVRVGLSERPMSSLRTVAVDARMIGHSGIGTATRGVLRAWARQPPGFSLRLMGDQGAIVSALGGEVEASTVAFNRGVYSPVSLLAGAPVGKADAMLVFHYPAA